MAVQAYVLVQTEVGKATEVAAAISALEGVESSLDVTGPYDVIAFIEGPSIDELGAMVISKIQKVGGITRTLTCPAVRA